MAKSVKNDFPSVEGITVLSLIGKGNFSRVYKGVQSKNNEKVAIKVIDKNDLTKGKVDDIVSEIGIMKSLHHAHIVQMRDFQWDSKSVYIILEYCEGGSLFDYIKLKNRLREHICKRALQQLASGLQYIRSKNICHMDLKPQNILIKFNPFFVKIADFGLAQYVPDKIYKENLRGSPLYMAPEILLAKKYNSKVDLWSVGIILYECIFGRAPLAHKNCQELIDCLKKEVPIKYPSTVPLSKDCKDLLEKLLVYDPKKRIEYDDFFSHPFIDLTHAPSEENKKLAFRVINEAVTLDEKKDYVNAFNSYCRALRYLVPWLESISASEERSYLQLKITEYLKRAEELKPLVYPQQGRCSKNMTKNDAQSRAQFEKMLFQGTDNISTLIASGLDGENLQANVQSMAISDETQPSRPPEGLKRECLQFQDYASGSSISLKDFKDVKDDSSSLGDDIFSVDSVKEAFTSSPKICDALDIGFSGQMYMMQGDYDIALSKYETALKLLIAETKDFPPGQKRDLLLFQIKKWLTLAESAKTLKSAKSINSSGNLKIGAEVLGRRATNGEDL